MPLDRSRRRNAISREVADPLGMAIERSGLGYPSGRHQTMEHALRLVSVERGRDPRRSAWWLSAAPDRCMRRGWPASRHSHGHRAIGRRRRLGGRPARGGAALRAPRRQVLCLDGEHERRLPTVYGRWRAGDEREMRRHGPTASCGGRATPTCATLARASRSRSTCRTAPSTPATRRGSSRLQGGLYAQAPFPRPRGRGRGGRLDARGNHPLGQAHAGLGRKWRASAPRSGTRRAWFPEAGGYVETQVIDRHALLGAADHRAGDHRGPRLHCGHPAWKRRPHEPGRQPRIDVAPEGSRMKEATPVDPITLTVSGTP